MFDHVATDDFIKLVVVKWVRQYAQVVNYIGIRTWVCIDAYGARKFVLTAANIQNLWRGLRLKGNTHRRVESIILKYELSKRFQVERIDGNTQFRT